MAGLVIAAPAVAQTVRGGVSTQQLPSDTLWGNRDYNSTHTPLLAKRAHLTMPLLRHGVNTRKCCRTLLRQLPLFRWDHWTLSASSTLWMRAII